MQKPQTSCFLKENLSLERLGFLAPQNPLSWETERWGRVNSQIMRRKERLSSDVCLTAVKPAALPPGHLAVRG